MSGNFKRALSAKAVEFAPVRDKPYKLSDGGGLHLLVRPNGSKLWRYKFRLSGREQLHSIGAYPAVSLAAARELHAVARQVVMHGASPVDSKRRAREAEKANDASRESRTFGAAYRSWRDLTDRHLRPATIRQRTREIDKDLMPSLGSRPTASIARVELTQLLRRVEQRAPETAKNLRSHLEAIFEHAIDCGAVEINPTPPRRVLVRRTPNSHRAMAEDRLGSFLRDLDLAGGTELTRVAILLVVITACRKSEIVSARWSEIDWSNAMLTIPAARMKRKREHLVPLSEQAMSLLRDLRAIVGTEREFLFPNRCDPSRPMADRSLNALIDRIGYSSEGTPHGFRSAFSTHFNELNAHPDVVELCLAHAPRGVRGIYNRALHLDERRKLLQLWSNWLDEQRGSPTVPSLARMTVHLPA